MLVLSRLSDLDVFEFGQQSGDIFVECEVPFLNALQCCDNCQKFVQDPSQNRLSDVMDLSLSSSVRRVEKPKVLKEF